MSKPPRECRFGGLGCAKSTWWREWGVDTLDEREKNALRKNYDEEN